MTPDQDIAHVRGDDLQVPVTVTLDQSRTLDGSESWLWAMRINETKPVLLTKTDPTAITIDGGTFQPTILLTPADFPTTTFPPSATPIAYVHELSMTKSGKVETILRGALTLTSDIAV